jgi:hypothetical protein
MNRGTETERTRQHESGPHSSGLTPELLASLLPAGADALDDERLCVCEHLEADHRTDGACSRCLLDRHRAPWRRCPEFRAVEDEDTTAVLAEDVR